MMSLGFVTHVFIFLVPGAICLKCRASPYTAQLSSGYVFTDTVRTYQKCDFSVVQWALIMLYFLFDQLNTCSMYSCC